MKAIAFCIELCVAYHLEVIQEGCAEYMTKERWLPEYVFERSCQSEAEFDDSIWKE